MNFTNLNAKFMLKVQQAANEIGYVFMSSDELIQTCEYIDDFYIDEHDTIENAIREWSIDTKRNFM